MLYRTMYTGMLRRSSATGLRRQLATHLQQQHAATDQDHAQRQGWAGKVDVDHGQRRHHAQSWQRAWRRRWQPQRPAAQPMAYTCPAGGPPTRRTGRWPAVLSSACWGRLPGLCAVEAPAQHTVHASGCADQWAPEAITTAYQRMLPRHKPGSSMLGTAAGCGADIQPAPRHRPSAPRGQLQHCRLPKALACVGMRPAARKRGPSMQTHEPAAAHTA